jgi:hypothetical protein
MGSLGRSPWREDQRALYECADPRRVLTRTLDPLHNYLKWWAVKDTIRPP